MNCQNGLTCEEVKIRKYQGLVNQNSEAPTKKAREIILSNIFTPFNILNLILAISILLVGSYKNVLFMGVVISNTIISIVQEIKSKKIIDKLTLLSEKKVTVKRNNEWQEINKNELVKDDIVLLSLGDQVPCDAIIISGTCEVNEAFITGESEAITKKTGDNILSGSFIESGKCLTKIIHVGLDNYVAIISKEAKSIKKTKSQIILTINKIVKIISTIIVPLGILILIKELNASLNFTDAVVHTVAALIIMIPEGLVLLTSMVLAVSIIRLSKYNVLVQELYSIEMLARVDTICLDKTGTLTEGKMEVSNIVYFDDNVNHVLGVFSKYSRDNNETIEAIRNLNFSVNDENVTNITDFSSSRKWSSITFNNTTYILGAPEFIARNINEDLKEKINFYSSDNRVVALFKSSGIINNEISSPKIMALILIKDKIRASAKQTLNFFKKEGVDIKIISGDNVKTVSNIAKRLGLNLKSIDMTNVTNDMFDDVVKNYNLFGRVTPMDKKKIILSLQKDKHVVAMTGDGVNDILALKNADCSIAMANGSEGARNVSDIVLLESNFDSLPKIVLEGRRSINNIERSASLYLTKTIYASLLAITFIFLPLSYPFVPIQISLIGASTIGIPSFFLALEKNQKRITGNFFKNILKHSLPTAIIIYLDILILSILTNVFNYNEISTMCVLITAYNGFLLLYKLCYPFNKKRLVLFIFMIIFFMSQYILLGKIYNIVHFSIPMLILTLTITVSTTLIYYYLNNKIKFFLRGEI